MKTTPEQLAADFIKVCLIELRSLKPGNVHVHSEGHGMTIVDFETAARIAAPLLVNPDLTVGQRIEQAVAATMVKTKQNINLGIILLAAPLMKAAQTTVHFSGAKPTVADLKASLRKVLTSLTTDDCAAVFRAIKLANPGGLGTVEEGDVRDPPPPKMTLYQAMSSASRRDRIAHNYISNYTDVFELGLVRLRTSLSHQLTIEWATTACYLDFLCSFPDSHILRKHGEEVAKQVQLAGQRVSSWIGVGTGIPKHSETLLDWDRSLKEEQLNPGTSADLTVTSLLAHELTI